MSRWSEHDVLAAAGAPLHSLPKRFRELSDDEARRENCEIFANDPYGRYWCTRGECYCLNNPHERIYNMGIPADSIANPVTREEPPIAKAHSALLDIMAFWENDDHGHQEAGELMYQRAKEALEAIGSLPPSRSEKHG